MLILIDKSGRIVSKDTNQLKKMTQKTYEILPESDTHSFFTYKSSNFVELDSVILMSKFYPWIIKYSQLKGLDPDHPRYLTKVTRTL